MKKYFLIAACLFSLGSSAQKRIDVDKTEGLPQNVFYSVGGEPFVNVKFVRLKSGSPYFKEEWMKGNGISATGSVYKAGVLRLDLVDNQVHYLDAEGKEMIATSPLKELILTDTVFNHTYHFVHSSLFQAGSDARQGWYLVLSAGKVGMYQFFSKVVSETTPYGSATTEQNIVTRDEFYLLHNNTLQQVKKPKDLPAILTDKKTELEEILKNNSKNKSTAEQFRAMVDHYNSLQ